MLAQLAHRGGPWSLGEIVILAIVAAALVGIVIVATNYFGIPVPRVVWQILGIVLVAALAILAVRFLLSL